MRLSFRVAHRARLPRNPGEPFGVTEADRAVLGFVVVLGVLASLIGGFVASTHVSRNAAHEAIVRLHRAIEPSPGIAPAPR